MLPIWAKIDYDFDAGKIREELMKANIFERSIVATTDYNEAGYSRWDPDGTLFPEAIFAKTRLIDHYRDVGGERTLIPGEYRTFRMLNLTELPDQGDSQTNAWAGRHEDNSKIPLWIRHPEPWRWREDLDIAYTRSVIQALPIEHVMTVRCVIQDAPSIGVVHRDSGPKMNQEYYEQGYGSITLNIAAGGANLWFLNPRDGTKYSVDESQHACWHFDDSALHCTTEVFAPRIQLRIFAKLSRPYQELFVPGTEIY